MALTKTPAEVFIHTMDIVPSLAHDIAGLDGLNYMKNKFEEKPNEVEV